jgi:hypothetical protein
MSSCGVALKIIDGQVLKYKFPCSLTAEAGGNSRGASAPQQGAPAEFLSSSDQPSETATGKLGFA